MPRASLLSAVLLLVACGGPTRPQDDVARPETQLIGAGGGTLVTTSGLRVSIPPGALPADVHITVSEAGSVPGGGFGAVEIGPTGTQFAKPVTLSFNYPATAANGKAMKVCTVVDGHWRALGGRGENAVAHLVLGQTTHLSPYAAVASTELCANGADDDGDGLIDCADPACLHDIACAASCDTDAQCEVNERCVISSCRYTAPTGGATGASTEQLPCNTDADCGAGAFVCRADLGYLCALPLPVQPDGGVDAGTVDGGPAQVTCTSDGNCEPGDFCGNDGRCHPGSDGGTPCYYDRDCASGQLCASGSCVAGPADGGPVDGGTSCEVDSDCAPGLACRDFRCVQPADGGYSDGGYSDGGYSDGGYSDGGYSDGGYSDGGYSDGGYSDGGYSDGGYSDGGSSAVDGGSADGGRSCSSDRDCPTTERCYSGVCY